MKATNEMKAQGWKDSQVAFADALNAGRLTLDPKTKNYVGHYMYMGPGKGGDAFKHIITREYLA